MTRAEIIENALREMGPFEPTNEPCCSEQDEEAFIISVLRDVLPDGVDIRTCEDFRHLNVPCCPVCHHYPGYEMSMTDLPDGGKAWVCEAVKQAIYPERHRDPQGALSSLKLAFGGDVEGYLRNKHRNFDHGNALAMTTVPMQMSVFP